LFPERWSGRFSSASLIVALSVGLAQFVAKPIAFGDINRWVSLAPSLAAGHRHQPPLRERIHGADEVSLLLCALDKAREPMPIWPCLNARQHILRGYRVKAELR
jgi:hypothetical protein